MAISRWQPRTTRTTVVISSVDSNSANKLSTTWPSSTVTVCRAAFLRIPPRSTSHLPRVRGRVGFDAGHPTMRERVSLGIADGLRPTVRPMFRTPGCFTRSSPMGESTPQSSVHAS